MLLYPTRYLLFVMMVIMTLLIKIPSAKIPVHLGYGAHLCSSDMVPTRVVDPDPGSGSVLDPYSIGSVDPDPYSESGSGSRRAKMTHKSRQ